MGGTGSDSGLVAVGKGVPDCDDAIRARLRRQHRELLVGRIRIGLWMVIAARLIQASIDLHSYPDRIAPLLPIALIMCAICGGALVTLRRCDSVRQALAVALTAASILWIGIAFSSVFRQGSTSLPIYMVLSIGMAALIPWGVVPQAVAVLTAEVSILAAALWVSGGVASAFSYLGVATLTAFGFSIYLAHRFERTRRVLAQREMEREQAHEALRRSESMLLAMFDHMEDVFYRTDLDGVIEMVSPSVVRYGYTVEHLVGRLDASLYDDLTEYAAVKLALLNDGSVSDFQVSLRRADGTPVPFSMSARLLRDAESRAIGVEGVLRDISQRVRQQQHIAALLELARDTGGTADLGERLDRVQRRTAELLPCDRVITLAWDARRKAYTVLSQSDARVEGLSMHTVPQFVPGTPFADTLAQAQTVVVDSDDGPAWRALLACFQARSLAAVPLHVRGRPIGALVAMNDARRDRFDAEQVELLEGIACHLGGAIEATQTMSSVSPVGIFRVDSEGYGTYVNERCAEIIGMSPAQAVGAPWGNCVHPDDRRRIIPEWIPALQAGRQFKSEYRICAPDGTVTWVLGQALADKGADGRIRGYVGTIVDITERKRAEDALQQSEQRYRTIFSAAPVSLWEEDFSLVKKLIDDVRASGVDDLRGYLDAHPDVVRQGVEAVRVIDVNDASLKLLGAGSRDELLTSLAQVFLPETYAVFKEELLAIAAGATSFESESCMQTLQGERLDILFSMSFPDHAGDFDHVLVSVIDVTERKRAERALASAERAKQDAAHAAADAERRRVARELHDGVLQDLGALKLLLEVQSKREPSEAADQLLQRLRQSLVDIRVVVDDLRTPDATLSLQDAIAAHAQVLTAQRPIALQLDLQALPVVDWAVRDLFRIAQEAIGNAVRHADPTHVTVRLHSGNGRTTLAIEDDGAGFEPNSAPAGTGLLGIRERAVSLGAELDIASRAGGGTVVRVTMPHGRALPGRELARRAISPASAAGAESHNEISGARRRAARPKSAGQGGR